MPSINKLINYNLATSVENNGFLKNLAFWGDESTIDSGSMTWNNKLPYGIGNATLYGSGSNYSRSGSVGFEFDGSSNYVTWNTSSFFDLNPDDGLVGDAYTLSVTLTPDNSTIPYSEFGINMYRPMALWQPTLTQNDFNVGYLPGIQLNDVCPGGPQKSYWVNYNSTYGGQTPYRRNQTYYSYSSDPNYNLNLIFVFTGVTQSQGPSVLAYVNTVSSGFTSLPLSWPYPGYPFFGQFGKKLSESTGGGSIADDRNTQCGSVSSNLPFFNFKGYVRDFAIWNKPLTQSEVNVAYRTLNRYSEINNS